MCLDICTHPLIHHHNQGNKHIHYLQKFLCAPLFLPLVVVGCFIFVCRYRNIGLLWWLER